MRRRNKVATRISRAPPEEQLRFLRSLPIKGGAGAVRRRLAEVPDWDGTVRFPATGDNSPWDDDDIHAAAWVALRSLARGTTNNGPATRDDPNDPPIVGQDIRARPNGPYGPSPGYTDPVIGARLQDVHDARFAAVRHERTLQ